MTDQDEEELSKVFKDMELSALAKAVRISPNVKSITLGSQSTISKLSESDLHPYETDESVLELSVPYCSTPKKSFTQNLSSSIELNNAQENKISNLSLKEKKPISDTGFSRQRLLQEYDFQRKLAVDKIMRERIKRMYNTGKLIRDSLEHLKQTRQEEAITRRMLLESKIISDIQEQEILDKPKREAQWEKDNLKEAQRIQERNQKVKEAEEEARKKSEALLLKRKQIEKILFELQKEYNLEYKNMLETIKLCTDKPAVTELTSNHSKMLKDCATVCENVLKKCKQGDVTEEDVKTSKKLVETIKSIHKYFSEEVAKINEAKQVKVPEVKEEEKHKIVGETKELSPSSGKTAIKYKFT